MTGDNGGQSLKASLLKPYLQACGYRPSLLHENFTLSPQINIPLLAFARAPADARSACIAVIDSSPQETQEQVENLRGLAAPVVFVCGKQGLEWWQQSTISPRRKGSIIPPDQLPRFFEDNTHELGPDVLYRAKTWGRFNQEFQLTFVDLGLMPLVESEIGHRLEQLIARNVQELKAALGWQTISESQGAWLLKVVFWLISAKILKDKDVAPFRNIDIVSVADTLDAVATHFGTIRIPQGNSRQKQALSLVAGNIASFSNLQLATTESLAYVYENTLISRETRQALGTHSTPPYLVDYIVGKVRPWIEEIPIESRNVYEPACGHGAFLVSAMRLLTELLPEEKSAPQQRRKYLRTRIHGSDIDAFALEIARLSLSLTDIPNPNGWDLTAGDVFLGNGLECQARSATVLLTNPPFENFASSEKQRYASSNQTPRFMNKSAELFSRVLPELPAGAVIGLITPQGFLHGRNATGVRRILVDQFEIQEICLFPDKVFTFSDMESAVVIGRKTSGPSGQARYRRVRERESDSFKETFAATTDRQIDAARFREDPAACLRVPDLEEVWNFCEKYPHLGTFVEIGQGFTYKGEGLPPGAKTYSDTKFPGAVEGFVQFPRGLMIHQLPQAKWLNLDKSVILRPRHGLKKGMAQVLFNGAPTSRGPWRIKGLIDNSGHPVTSRFIVMRPPPDSKYPLEFFWALCNSPCANAYAYCHCGKRENIAGVISKMPIPPFDEKAGARLVELAKKYWQEFPPTAKEPLAETQTSARRLLMQIDSEIVGMYAFPADIESQLLRLFTGWKRNGVPFSFDEYLPQHFDDSVSLAELISITDNWASTNRRRDVLIRKKVDRILKADEKRELEGLQRLASLRRRLVAPLPLKELESYLQELKSGALE